MLPMRRYQTSWMPSIFDDFFDTDFMPKTKATAPAINVIEDEARYTVEVAAPGMAKEDFKIHVDDDNNLVIAIEKQAKTADEPKQADREKKQMRYLRREFHYAKFQQTLILPDDVDKQGISASVANGVLTVTLPKLTPEQKQQTLRTIEVR